MVAARSHILASLMVPLLALIATFAPQAGAEPVASTWQQRVDQLQTELQNLRQTIALLHGGAAVVAGPGQLSSAVGQPFVPQTANTQRTLATRATLWPHHWSFQSAVTADNKVTITHVMTDRPAGAGAAWCVIVGDAGGLLYFFNPQGHLLSEHNVGSGSAVTALSSNLVRSNTTHLAVGLQDGTVLLLAVGHESVRIADGHGITSITTLLNSSAADRATSTNTTQAQPTASPIRHLAFTKSQQRRVLIAVDGSGAVVLLAQATGRVIMTRQLEQTPLAVNMNNDFQMMIQTPLSAVVLLMHRGRSKITRPCTGLTQTPATHTSTPAASPAAAATQGGGSSSGSSKSPAEGACPSSGSSSATESTADLQHPQAAAAAERSASLLVQQPAAAAAAVESNVLVAAAFDPVRSHRVYGVTAGGDLVALGVPSAQRTNLCKVLQRTPLGLPPGPVRLIATKGRLIVLHAAGVAAFNTSSNTVKLAGSHVVSHTWEDMWRLYGLDQQRQQQQSDDLPQQQHHGSADSSQQQQQGRSSTDLADSKADVATSRRLHEAAGDSSSSSRAPEILHTAAADSISTVLAAAAAANLLLLPLGDKGVAVFSDTPGLGSTSANTQGGGGGASDSVNIDWFRMLQPFVVIMMVGVAVWQFLRASNKNTHLRTRRMDPQGIYDGSGFSGLEGLRPGDLGEMGLSAGLFGGTGFSGLDRDMGDYTGHRGPGVRPANRMQNSLLDMGYGGLNAVNARRRARHIMHGRADPDSDQRGLGGLSGRSAGSGFSRGAGAGEGRGSVARQQQQQQPQRAGAARSAIRQPETSSAVQTQQASNTRQNPSDRRVTFEDNVTPGQVMSGPESDSGGDDLSQMQVPLTPGPGMISVTDDVDLQDAAAAETQGSAEAFVSPRSPVEPDVGHADNEASAMNELASASQSLHTSLGIDAAEYTATAGGNLADGIGPDFDGAGSAGDGLEAAAAHELMAAASMQRSGDLDRAS